MAYRNGTARCMKLIYQISRPTSDFVVVKGKSNPRVRVIFPVLTRSRFLSTADKTIAPTASDEPSSTAPYVSPAQDFFEMIHNNKISSGKNADDYNELPENVLRCGVKESDLVFKTVAYGRAVSRPHILPQEHKVKMEVNVDDIPFESELQKKIFFQIVGPRYDEEHGVVRLQSKQFASRIENKRHAVSMLERIMESSKELANQ